MDIKPESRVTPERPNHGHISVFAEAREQFFSVKSEETSPATSDGANFQLDSGMDGKQQD